MRNQFSRTELLIKKEGLKKLNKSKVAIFGIGGVGSYVVEALARAGVKSFVLVDDDKVSITNINRQLIATFKTIGMYKVDVMEERILDINPEADVTTYKEFYMPGTKSNIINEKLDYVVDCIDTITAKIEIIKKCSELNIPVISSMGTGNKLDPSKFEIADIYKTKVCPLAKVMRRELRKQNIEKLKVLYSKEEPIEVEEQTINLEEETSDKRRGKPKKNVPGSISFVPSVAGLMIAGEVVRDLLKGDNKNV